MTAKIVETNDGRFALLTRTGSEIATYARRRDAVRGATRRGFAI